MSDTIRLDVEPESTARALALAYHLLRMHAGDALADPSLSEIGRAREIGVLLAIDIRYGLIVDASGKRQPMGASDFNKRFPVCEVTP